MAFLILSAHLSSAANPIKGIERRRGSVQLSHRCKLNPIKGIESEKTIQRYLSNALSTNPIKGIESLFLSSHLSPPLQLNPIKGIERRFAVFYNYSTCL